MHLEDPWWKSAQYFRGRTCYDCSNWAPNHWKEPKPDDENACFGWRTAFSETLEYTLLDETCPGWEEIQEWPK